jgi:dihydroorotate dehydrogenase (fumarate)
MTDLRTTYLGLSLKNPIVASSSPLSKRIDNVRRLEDAGAAAVVLFSLFEEQITHEARELDYYLDRGAYSFAESLTYFPDLEQYNLGVEPYLEHVHALKQRVSIPIIASLNGPSDGDWVEYARKIEQAGADALELNLYFLATDPDITGAAVEEQYLRLVRDVCSRVTIPVAVKMSPFFSSIANIAKQFSEAGARGLVLFNRFYQPDFDLEALEVVPNLKLSTSDELRLPLRWIAILYGRIKADLALTSGVHTAEDVLKAMMAGARVAMMTSELLARGIDRIPAILQDIRTWMEEHEYESIEQMQGSMSQQAVDNPAAFERANYIRALGSFG